MKGVGTTISPQSISSVYHILWASGTGNLVWGIKTQQICCGPTRSPLGSPFIFVYWGKSPAVSHPPSLLPILQHNLQAECHSGGLEHTSERLLPLRMATVAP